MATNRRILVIDDTRAIHDDFRKILGSKPAATTDLDDLMASVLGEEPAQPKAAAPEGFELDSAYQGEEALEKVKQARAEGRPYAVAFVDVRMPPGWDGVETIQRMWQEDPALQAIICTAFSDYSWDQMAKKLGHSDSVVILKKPFDPVEVLQLAHALTTKWNLARQASTKLEELEQMVQDRTTSLRNRTTELHREIAGRVQAEERFAKAFNSSPLPMAIVRTGDLGCVDANRTFLAAIERTRAETLGNDLAALGVELDETLDAALKAGNPLVNRECKFAIAGAAPGAARLWSEPFKLAGSLHLLIILEDVSAHAELEAQLRQRQKMESVGHLAAGVAHDLNNILTVIQGHASMRLAAADLPEPVTKSFHDMNEAATRAASLTRQLLAFSRRQVMQPRVVRLNTIVDNLGTMLRRLIPENIVMDVRQPAQLPPVHADVCNLEQVVLNLTVNARDAMPEGGRITIATEEVAVGREHLAHCVEAREGRFVRLTVSDTGTGIDSGTLQHIFEPFYTTKEVGKGTGMGLATVHGIINQHEGWIEVTSAPGQGATFHIYLPVTDRAESDPDAPLRAVAPLPAATRTILVVEDEEIVRSLAEAVLQGAGYQVLAAEDGNAALAIWRSHPGTIDLLLTDMVMPGGISGKDLAERMTSERPSLKVLYSSGYSYELFGEQLELRDGHDYLPKPYFSQDLLNAVHRLLDLRSASATADRCAAA
jgi:signal transduction histidine kinase/two-component SAPR family response regulator